MNKYKNKKTIYDGILFDSIKEMNRYKELKMLEKQGHIRNLRVHQPFTLIPAQYETVERYGKRGERLKDGCKIVERECRYIADFVYIDCRTSKEVVEDVKSKATKYNAEYRIKRKLMRYVHGIEIMEV